MNNLPKLNKFSGLVSLLLFVAPGSLLAQSADGAAGLEIEEIVITGTRLEIDGTSAPTPVTVVTGEELLNINPNIVDAVRQLPQLVSSSSEQSLSRALDQPPSTGSQASMRNLGAVRTLTMVNGRRLAINGATGVSDANVLPLNLVQRVDVVTGGASAVYGSDAVAGVVNYILDTDYEGLKVNLSGGTSAAGDGNSMIGDIAFGTSFADGNGHLLLSARTRARDRVEAENRDWANSNRVSALLDGEERFRFTDDVRLRVATETGVITSVTAASAMGGGGGGRPGGGRGMGGTDGPANPFENMQFAADGSLIPFDPGMPAAPPSPLSVGGDGAWYVGDLVAENAQDSFFAHLDYDLSEDFTIFGEVATAETFSEYRGRSAANSSVTRNEFVIRNDNAFLDPAMAATMRQRRLASFNLGKISSEIGRILGVAEQTVSAATFGFDYQLNEDSAVSAYYAYSKADLAQRSENLVISDHILLATDAVDSGGTITCRSTLSDPNNGCVPWNPMGTNPLTDAQRAYMVGTAWSQAETEQKVLEVSLDHHGLPSFGYAPISAAAGIEFRDVQTAAENDPISDVRGFQDANRTGNRGAFDTSELFAEALVPLVEGVPIFRQLDINAAIRRTDHSASGTVTTWKTGLTNDFGGGFRLRVSSSRDIRAPNISELYGDQTTRAQRFYDPAVGYEVGGVILVSGSNPELLSEEADTFSAGLIWSPEFLQDFSLAVDYYDIEIDNSIRGVDAESLLFECHAGGGVGPVCDLITRNRAGEPTEVIALLGNVQNFSLSGYDVSLRHRAELGGGTLASRLVATVQDEYLQYRFEEERFNRVGYQQRPRLYVNLNLNYSRGPFVAAVQQRYIHGVERNVPWSSRAPIVDEFNEVDPTWYTNFTARYRFGEEKALEVFATVNNLFDRDPPPGQSNCQQGFCAQGSFNQFDKMGRFYTVGFRYGL